LAAKQIFNLHIHAALPQRRNNMKVRTIVALVVLLAVSLPVWGASPAAAGFDSLKTLAGAWDFKGPDGKPAQVTWRLVSGGSALMEELPHDSMVTMYHLNNDKLLMTHYCSAMNQPRMQADISADGKTITFNFLDATNLASPNDGHMQKMVLTFKDKDHFSEQWVFSKDGKDAEHMTFDYTRKQ
jgi:hypothetical protein